MTEPTDASALALERSCALTATVLSDARREGVRLVTGRSRVFGLNAAANSVHVPYPAPSREWTRRTTTCGIALQCSPSKERLAEYRISQLSARELRALTAVEGGVALGWALSRWPGLEREFHRSAPDVVADDADMTSAAMIRKAVELARASGSVDVHPLLGRLTPALTTPGNAREKLRRQFGRMPWSTTEKRMPQPHSTPAGGDGGVRNPNLPPPSRPEDDDADVTPDHRPGIPYPEWNAWTKSFLPDHVAVREYSRSDAHGSAAPTSADLRAWFEERTHRAMTGRLDDGSDLDVDQYVSHYLDLRTGEAGEPRLFRELRPTARDVSTALLIDGSSSLGVHGGQLFRLEIACADALSRAMALARERHGIFTFTGNSRHCVEVRCLKDFQDRTFVPPSGLGLATGGYTRLGAPIRHLTSRLLAQPSERRLMIVIGDGLISDEGYEGGYAWADSAHSVEEANDAGVSVYYVGVGPARVDPLPDVFGSRRSQRIRRVEDLPRVLAHVHRELVST